MTKRFALRPLRHALLLAVAIGLAGCGGSDDDDDDGGGTTGGGTTGGTTGDGTTGGGTTGGTTGGGTTGGDGEVVIVPLGDVSGDVADFGYVTIEQPGDSDDPFAAEGGIDGFFLRFPGTIPALDAIEGFQPALDTCEVDTFTFSDIPDDFDFDFEFQALSAGEQLVFTGPGGTYVELPREQLQFEGTLFIAYQLDGESLPGPVPSGLTLDIPGDDFPAFSAVDVPDVEPLTGVTPEFSFTSPTSITADTVFGWDAGSNPDAYISISASSTNFGGDGISVTNVDCLAVDDGEFAFPAATRAELGDFSTTSADVARTGVTILRRGNALLVVSNRSSG